MSSTSMLYDINEIKLTPPPPPYLYFPPKIFKGDDLESKRIASLLQI